MAVESVFGEEAREKDKEKVKKGFWKKMKKFAGQVPFAVDAVALYYYITDEKQLLLEKSPGIFALLYLI